MDGIGAVIMAAGDGKRMKSATPKPMLEVLFRPMVDWVYEAALNAGASQACVVCPPDSPLCGHFEGRARIALQRERLGTGHAVLQAAPFIEDFRGGEIVVLSGDMPLCPGEVIRSAITFHRTGGYDVSVITATVQDPAGYGRIVRSGHKLDRIVEHKDADACVLAIREINSGAYVFSADALLAALKKLDNRNASKEYYLTDTVALILAAGGRAGAFDAGDERVVLGANDPWQLYELNRLANERVLRAHAAKGVRFVSLDGIVIAPDAHIGADTVILPGTLIKGGCSVGFGCTIGPNTVLDHSRVGDGSTVNASHILHSRVGDRVTIGPFTQLRPGCDVKDGAKIGDFVEVKNSVVGEKTSISHLTYIGDSDVGGGVNFGCGVVTVNYDGAKKARTVIGDNAFVGCNANLIAPVSVGDGAYVAAGTTVTEDVPPGDMAIGRARQSNKKGYAKGRFHKK